jgi:hypothetical protein
MSIFFPIYTFHILICTYYRVFGIVILYVDVHIGNTGAKMTQEKHNVTIVVNVNTKNSNGPSLS